MKERYEFLANGGQICEEICPVQQIIESTECDFPDSDLKEISKINQSQSAVDQKIVTKMEKLFECSTTKAIELYIALKRPNLDDLNIFGEKLKWLKTKNVTISVITDNCKMLLKPLGTPYARFPLLKIIFLNIKLLIIFYCFMI